MDAALEVVLALRVQPERKARKVLLDPLARPAPQGLPGPREHKDPRVRKAPLDPLAQPVQPAWEPQGLQGLKARRGPLDRPDRPEQLVLALQALRDLKDRRACKAPLLSLIHI